VTGCIQYHEVAEAMLFITDIDGNGVWRAEEYLWTFANMSVWLSRVKWRENNRIQTTVISVELCRG